MQTLLPAQYLPLAEKSRNPCAKVVVTSGIDSIPFAGQRCTPQDASEYTPEVINHVSGRYCIAFTRVINVSGTDYRHLHFKNTTTDKITFNSAIDLTSLTPNHQYDYYDPCLVAIGSLNIGIVVNRNSGLYSTVVTAQDGTEVTALTNLSITGEHPTLYKMGINYWLMYERSGELYYKTSTDFVTWNAEVLFNTGLTHGKDYPCLTQDHNGKKWLLFEREDDVSTPPLKNIYYMTSTDNGASWSGTTVLTDFTTGDGQATKPKLVDTTEYIWFSYVIKRTVQNLQYKTGNTPYYQPKMFQLDEINDRIGMLVGNTVAQGLWLVIYDCTTGLYTEHDLTIHGMTTGTINCLGYDEANQIWVIGTSDDGLIVYNESTTVWSQYNTTSTPAINYKAIAIGHLKVSNSEIFFATPYPFYQTTHYRLNLNSDTLTVLGTYYIPGTSNYLTQTQIEISDTYIVFMLRTISL